LCTITCKNGQTHEYEHKEWSFSDRKAKFMNSVVGEIKLVTIILATLEIKTEFKVNYILNNLYLTSGKSTNKSKLHSHKN